MAREFIQQNTITYRYQLEKSRRGCKVRCPKCRTKASFKKYVDVTTGEYVGDDVGKCDRLKKCGHHRSPREAKDAFVPLTTVVKKYQEPEYRSSVSASEVMKAMSYGRDTFSKSLIEMFPHKDVQSVLNQYWVGVSDKWRNSTIFWQIDQDFTCRTGKIMQYDGISRVKNAGCRVGWVHSPSPNNDYGDFNLRQCLFGQHLIGDKPIGVVESEKTAIICAIFKPSTTWVATGGLNNISSYRFEFAEGRDDLTFYPDKGCESDWERKVGFIDPKWKISKVLQNQEDLAEGDDLGDLLVKLKTPKT